jgi:hypothetical protein
MDTPFRFFRLASLAPFAICQALFGLFSETYHHPLAIEEKSLKRVVWEMSDSIPFDELIIGWNGNRPKKGRYCLFVSLRQNSVWSPWLYYAEWGSPGQIMFHDRPENAFAFAYEGRVSPKQGKCDAFRIQIEASGGAELEDMRDLFALALDRKAFAPKSVEPSLSTILIPNFPRQSQVMTRHFRYLDLSLPICMTLAVNYLYGERRIEPLDFAAQVIDDDTQFYENWSFNAAQAASYFPEIQFKIAYLPDFKAIQSYLSQNMPVIVPISGWIPGGIRRFRTEHAICLIGYDALTHQIQCIDPSFPSDKATFVSYALEDFLRIWAKHYNKAILIERRS